MGADASRDHLAPQDHLAPRQSAEVLALAVRTSMHDGVRPLSEQTVLDLRRLHSATAAETPTKHLLVQDRPGEVDARLLGYAHVEPSAGPSVELVVNPEHRRQGVGTALVRRILQLWPGARLWAHGDLPGARALAARLGLDPVRDLWQMSRPLSGEWSELPDVPLPDGFAVRHFEVGRDEQAWLQVNARSFAAHPEQGRTTAADLAERIAEPWFDPSGFLLIEDRREPTGPRPPPLAAFHWTKVEPAEPGHSTPTGGEVYVLGVDPDYQGMGLGKVATVLGLRHLRARGLDAVTLYVDGDNAAAIATYHRLGFERSAIDVMYAAGT